MSGGLRLCVNWLPISPPLTRELARRVERAGWSGMGIGDSPHYGELYAACADALAATERITISTGVTNPVTRHSSVHAGAARTFSTHYPGRFRLGIGRGDSAVRTFGLAPARLHLLAETLQAVRAAAPDTPLLVAASGPAAARLAGRLADGVIAGVGTDPAALAMVTDAARDAHTARRETDGRAHPEIWASVRLAVATDRAAVPALRDRLIGRAVSAGHFAYSGGTANRHIPAAVAEVLAERYARYDYAWHGRSGRSPNAALFADRPDVEDFLLHRFAIFGTAEDCRDRLHALRGLVDGVFASLLFEDVLDQFDRVADLFPGGVVPQPPPARRGGATPAHPAAPGQLGGGR